MPNGVTILVAGVVTTVALGVGAVVTIVLAGGSTDAILARAGLITAMVAPTVAALLALLQGARNQEMIQQTKDLVNGHLTAHIGHTDEQIRAIVTEVIAQMQQQQQP